MADYKFYKDSVNNTTNVGVIYKGKVWIPLDPANKDYQQFLQDVKEQGLSIVEGPDVLVKEDYATARREAYGPIEDQLDKIYHKGIDVWKSDILAIKDAIPRSQQRTTSVGSVPDWVQTEAAAYSS